MRVLLIGSGGREHALAWKLTQSPLCDHLWIAPGNPGTAELGTNVALAADDAAGIVGLATREQIDLVIVGPEAPLVAGLAEVCEAVDLPIFGPTSSAAQIEGSKAFAKRMMTEAGVPTGAYHIFDDPQAASDFVRADGGTWVVKADGLAAGKGVIVPEDNAATLAAIADVAATPAGQRLVLEEPLQGQEVSLLAICDGERAMPLLAAQDYKRLHDDDRGPNTGGMGAYAPAPILPAAEAAVLVDLLCTPILRTLAQHGTPYRGVLYAGIMLTAAGPLVLEYNARFGDPETQALLPLLQSDLLELAWRAATDTLAGIQLQWLPATSVCVVVAAPGYPQQPETDLPIGGLDTIPADVLVFHAGTQRTASGELHSAGGRVLNLVGLAPTLQEAREQVYAAIDQLQLPGMQIRRDIGLRGIES